MHPGGVSGPDVIFAQYADDPPYKEKVGPLIAKFGGRYLVRAGELTTMGDDWKPERIVILEFADSRPYGTCVTGGTPTSITYQAPQHGPMDLVQKPGVLWILTEYPLTVRWVPTDGRPHSEDPDVSFNGESVGHWEGETLVVDTIAIDERMKNMSVGRGGTWTHSDQERVIERFTRTSENYLTYQVTVIDPVVLERPFFSPPLTWTLAQAADDVWTEYLCTANEEPLYMEKMDPETKKLYDSGELPPAP